MKNRTFKVLPNQQFLLQRKMLVHSHRTSELAMDELAKIYWHEKQLLIAIPILISSATTFELVDSLTVLHIYTRNHVKKLEANFPSLLETIKSNEI